MRDFNGIPYASIPHPTAPDFSSRLRNALGIIDVWARDVSQGMARITAGQVPNGSSNSVFGNAPVTPGSEVAAVQGVDQSGNIQEWRRFGGDLVGYVDVSGIFNVQVLKIVSVGNGTLLAQVAATSGVYLGHGLTVFSGTGDLGLGSVVATIDNTGFATLTGLSLVGGSITVDADGFVDAIPIKDSGTGNIGQISWTGIGVGDNFAMPVTGAGGVLLSAASTANVSSKTFLNSTKIRCETSNGTTFQDSSSTTKQMRYDLTGITAGQTRNQKWQDTAGSVVVVGNTAAASGVLGTIALTAQTNSLAAQTMLTGNASSAGLYRLAFYMKTTTAGSGGDVVKATLAWNDGSAQSMDVPMMNATAIVNNLDLGTLNAFVQGSVVVKAAASQNVTFTTTVTKAGSPQYSVDCRIEALG